MALPAKRLSIAAIFAIVGGLVQVVAALAVLFLPILSTCEAVTGGPLVCSQVSYLQYGGNLLGYLMLIVMVAVGVAAINSVRDSNYRRIQIIRWLAGVLSGIVVVAAGWSFGIIFAPGMLLLFVAALWTKPQTIAK